MLGPGIFININLNTVLGENINNVSLGKRKYTLRTNTTQIASQK